jgi:hypothetical protein
MSIPVILIYLLLAWTGLKKTVEGKNKLEAAVFIFIMAVSFLYNYFGIIRAMRLPYINDLVSEVLDPISRLIFSAGH